MIFIEKGELFMKYRKKILSAIALTLCAATLTACSTTSPKITFVKYWLEDASVTPSNVLEELEYEVTFKKASGLNDAYTVDYKNGVYTTKLTLNEDVYRYETQFNIDVSYTIGEDKFEAQDSILSWVEFKKPTKLQPIASHK